MGASCVQQISNEGWSDQWGDSHTEVDDTEKMSDILVNETNQDNHAGDFSAKPWKSNHAQTNPLIVYYDYKS